MDELQEIATRFQVQLEGLKTNEYQEFNRVIAELTAILESNLGSRDLPSLTRKQLEELVKQVKSQQSGLISEYVEDLIEALKDLARYSYEFEAGAIVAGSAVEAVSNKVKMTALWKEILERPITADGALPRAWLDRLTDVQVTATENLIRRGHAEGWSTQEMLRSYRGTRANRFMDGVVAKTARSNETTIRTVMQHVNAVSRQKVWVDNDDIVQAYRIVATLDSRTTSTCRSLDGQEYPVGKGPLPPFHPNCRTTTVPVLDPVFDELRKGLTRSAEGGPVPQTMTYYDWLKTQSAEYQDSVIGEKRGKLFRDGGLSVAEFARLQLNRRFEPITLEEMRRLKPLAFAKAGI